MSERFRLGLHKLLIGAAGEVEWEIACPEGLEQGAGPEHRKVIALDRSVAESRHPVPDPFVEPAEILCL